VNSTLLKNQHSLRSSFAHRIRQQLEWWASRISFPQRKLLNPASFSNWLS